MRARKLKADKKIEILRQIVEQDPRTIEQLDRLGYARSSRESAGSVSSSQLRMQAFAPSVKSAPADVVRINQLEGKGFAYNES